MENSTYDLLLFRGAENDSDVVRAEGFGLAGLQDQTRLARLIDQLATKTICQAAALPEPEAGAVELRSRKPAGQLTAIFSGHDPLQVLENGRDWGAVVLEWLGAIGD